MLSPAAPIIGASGGVFGVMLRFAHFWPNEPIHIWGIIPVPARLLVIVTTVIALWSGFSGRGGNIAHFAHLGGYVGAFLYLRWLDRARTRFKAKATGATRATPAVRTPNYRAIDRSQLHEVNRDGGRPHPRQDQRVGDRVADRAGAAVPVQLRAARRSGTHEAVTLLYVKGCSGCRGCSGWEKFGGILGILSILCRTAMLLAAQTLRRSSPRSRATCPD